MEEPILNTSHLHITPASAERHVPYFLYEFVKTYLYALYSGIIHASDLHVVRIAAKADSNNPKPRLVSVTDEAGSFRVSDAHIDATVIFREKHYDLTLVRARETIFTTNTIYMLGTQQSSREPKAMMDFLLKAAVEHSAFNHACLEVYAECSEYCDQDIYVHEATARGDRLEEVYLPDALQEQIALFIHALTHFEKHRQSLRYLFSGKPGTGKTKIIRAIANACRDKATFIFTDGSETRIERLFEFVEFFSPVVLCIDDIDLITGSREERQSKRELAQLLQKLDGFTHKDFFLLATTNDKRLVDLAASRPGRFDLVIDVSLIQPQQHADLIRSKTDNSDIINLFDEEVLALLERKNVTGAFIANLIKHLELVSAYAIAHLNRAYLLKMINQTHGGFYKTPEPTNGNIGFHVTK